MKKKFRKEMSIGLGCFDVSMVLNRFNIAPSFIQGGVMGLAFAFEIIGVLPERAYSALKSWKKSMFCRA